MAPTWAVLGLLLFHWLKSQLSSVFSALKHVTKNEKPCLLEDLMSILFKFLVMKISKFLKKKSNSMWIIRFIENFEKSK